MSLGIVSGMELRKDPDNIALMSSRTTIKHDLWPLDEIDTDKAKFPCCLVWTPLPVISWLAPFIGHVGICREDGAIIDFTGSNFINVDDFAFGAAARYVQLDRSQCCFPMHQADHTCKQSYQHSEFGTSITWDDALRFDELEHGKCGRSNIFEGALGQFHVCDKVVPPFYGGGILWTISSRLAFRVYTAVVLIHASRVVSDGYVLF
ncbi:hypothetical protein ACFE04_017965 [Oxalis oulophora]